MSKKLTTDEFIQKAITIHGDRYDYNLVNYTGCYEEIEIVCLKHGPFWKTPVDHIQGYGCHKCITDFSSVEYNKSLNNNQSYLLGFLQSDGHRNSRHTNNIRIELSIRDVDILEKIKCEFSIHNDVGSRTRDTNFEKNYTSCALSIHGSYIANMMNYIPIGSKSEIVQPPPDGIYSEVDYWRGFIDGDGSVGFREMKGRVQPFIGLGTSSEYIARSFEKFVFKYFYSKNHSNRNKRDGTFNIIIGGYYSIIMADKLYYQGCLSLDRKMINATSMLKSNFIANQKHKEFSREEDILLLEHRYDKKYIIPNRIPSVSKQRLKFLLKKDIDNIDKLFDLDYFI